MSEIYVYGHKNPDSDSICSAIATAHLKNKMLAENKQDPVKHFGLFEEGIYLPRATGEANDETKFILNKFGVEHPDIVSDIRRQVKDLSTKEKYSASENISIKTAWDMIDASKTNSLILEDTQGCFKGIVTLKDIAKAYMDLADLQGKPIELFVNNIVDVLDAVIISESNVSKVILHEVVLAKDIKDINTIKDNIILLIDAKSKQFMGGNLSIQNKPNLILVCGDNEEFNFAKNLKAHNNNIETAIISTNYDLITTARKLPSATDVKSIMVPNDKVIKFCENDFVDDIKNELSQNRYREFPVTDSLGNVIGMIDKSAFLDTKAKRVVMVDHNELGQGVFGLYENEVIEIIDHHKLSTIETKRPLNVTTMQVGCTGTIVFSMFKNSGIDIEPKIAGLLCGAIMSDTMYFKSPTCTPIDKDACMELAKIAEINLDEFWQEMLDASLNFRDKTDKELLYQDFKKFSHNGFSFGLGQVMVANQEDMKELGLRIFAYMESEYSSANIDMMGLLITDVSSESSELLFLGDNSKSIVESAFGKVADKNKVFLEGVVSRKKQIVPQLLGVLEQ